MAAKKTSIVPRKSVAPKKSIAPRKSIAPKKSVAPKMKPAGPGVCICGAQGKTLLAKVISQVNPEGSIAAEPRAFEVQFCPSCTGRIRAGKELEV